jgi:aspartate/methionine/tyrosine aminotransferase
MFSSRVPSLSPNTLSRALREARAASRPLIDLTLTNPTKADFVYPARLLTPLASPAALVYEPAPFGLGAAREAVARDYARRGCDVPSGRIILTSSTSEAYSLLFKLLCEPAADDVLTPMPSYPLFEHLTRLDGVSPVPYLLEYDGRWRLDRESVASAWNARTRAVLAVTPNNPTGSRLSADEIDALSARCADRNAALIVDEVFADYPLGESPPAFARHDHGRASAGPRRSVSLGVSGRQATAGEPSSPRAPSPQAPSAQCLTFRLAGLSKSAGLPQVKLAWIAVDGPDALVDEALQRLEYICDAYLSVSTPVQEAAAMLLDEGAEVRRQIAERVRGNYNRLQTLGRDHPSIDVLHADAGWSAVIRVPSRETEETLVLELLREGVVVHPGFFFDFAHEAFLVVSLLPAPSVFEEGIARVLARVR